MAPVTFLAIGPIGTVIGDWLGQGYNAIYAFSPIIAGLLMGSLWQVLVMFGIRGLCTNYDVKLNTRWRYDGTNVITSRYCTRRGCFSCLFPNKNVKLKVLALSSSITTILELLNQLYMA